MKISEKYNLPIIEDACQSILANINNKNAGTWGLTGAFSLHPLKNINVWADGGIIVTNDENIYSNLKLLRNHGLQSRDNVEILGFNSRLDTFQAVIANWLLPKAEEIAEKRIQNAIFLDSQLRNIPQISIPERRINERVVYHLYMVRVKHRDKLLKYLNENHIEAKVHYPIPIYRQKALKHLNYKIGDFPNTDNDAENLITFPCDQHLEKEQLLHIVDKVKQFYSNVQ
jgi:dTDP-4-amino-4,6-dideoxygalactose transaminase